MLSGCRRDAASADATAAPPALAFASALLSCAASLAASLVVLRAVLLVSLRNRAVACVHIVKTSSSIKTQKHEKKESRDMREGKKN